MRKAVLLGLALALLFIQSASAVEPNQLTQIYFAGSEGSLKTSLSLYDGFRFVQDLQSADVIVLSSQTENLEGIANRVRNGAGLLVALWPDLSTKEAEILFGRSIKLTFLENEISLVASQEANDPVVQAVIWNSAPQVKERIEVSSIDINPLVEAYEDQSLILGSTMHGKGKVFIFTPVLGPETNLQFQQWAYFNYLIYHLVQQTAQKTPLSFGQYPVSPVPHEVERLVIFLILALILAFVGFLFWSVRRYSLKHPEELNVLVVDREEYRSRQETTSWDEIGFHRPLGGFMLAFMIGVVAFIPMIIYQNMILPAYILPSAQALGIWGRVTQFFQLLWQLFDLGTGAAFVKFFSEYRVHDPRKAVQYGQVFIWWQLLSGAVQVAIVTTVASVILPDSAYALYAWSVIIHSMIQIPGFLGVMRLALNAYQRADYGQIVTIATEVLLPILVQPICVTLMVIWGRSNPVFGESMGGLLGLGISAYMIQVLAFLIGLWLYRRLGYNVRVLFLAHFDWKTITTAFRFGAFEMLGSAAWAAGQALEIVVTQAKLINYAEIWGNWGLAQNFIFAFQVVGSLYDNLMPSISEAISNGRKLLGRYYSVMAYKWGGIISAYIGAVLLAVADRFIIGASGPQFARAAVYSIPLILWGAIQYPSWVGDNVQLGSNKPYLKMILVAGEQSIRIILAWLLIDQLQVTGLILAYFIGLLAKDIVAYFINNRLCYKQQFFFWQSLAAPLLAGIVHFLFLRWFTGLIWQADQITSVVIFFIGILPSYPLFAFLYGLFGGWDDSTLAELYQAVELSNFMRPLSWLFWFCSALGARMSPLHNSFPITIRAAALDEARSLMAERVKLS